MTEQSRPRAVFAPLDIMVIKEAITYYILSDENKDNEDVLRLMSSLLHRITRLEE